MAWAYFPLGTEPKPLDIVFCRFPYDAAPAHPAPDPHPCVVKRSFEDQSGNPWLRVVYGTSQPVRVTYGAYKIPIAELSGLGLSKETTICLWRIAEVPYAQDFFPLVGGRSIPTAYPMGPSLARDFVFEAGRYDTEVQPKVNVEPGRAAGDATEA